MSVICRILPHDAGDGPSNMALDEALLDSVAADPTMAVVRTYEWTIPTLSLGYFQHKSEIDADSRWSSVPVVRRLTGGGALWHEFEVTYTVVIPGQHAFARPSRALYQSVHEAMANQFRSIGIPAARRGVANSEVERQSRSRPFLCFTDRDEEDVVFRNTKLVGSAQRRRSGAILQHGSLLLNRSKTTPELPGLNDLAPMAESAANWVEILQRTLSEALEIPCRADELTLGERLRAEQLRQSVYTNPCWTLRL